MIEEINNLTMDELNEIVSDIKNYHKMSHDEMYKSKLYKFTSQLIESHGNYVNVNLVSEYILRNIMMNHTNK